MVRVHEFGEECALYPCEECGYRGQDIISLNDHIAMGHDEPGFEDETSESVYSITSTSLTLEEMGIQKLPEISKRIKQNFDGIMIDAEGNLDIDESDDEYLEDEDEKLLIDGGKRNKRKARQISNNNLKKQKSVSNDKLLDCEICGTSFTRKDNLARHLKNKHK